MHVFSSGPMCSLRRALLFWLVPLFLIVGVTSAVFSYWTFNRMVSTFLDDQMQQLALSVAGQEQHDPLPVLTSERVHKWGTYVIQVYDTAGHLQANSWPPLEAPLPDSSGFRDVRSGGKLWHAYATPAGAPAGYRVQVFQSGDFRRHLAAERAGAALAPVMILLPLAILVLWGFSAMVSRELRGIGQKAVSYTHLTLPTIYSV